MTADLVADKPKMAVKGSHTVNYENLEE